MDRSLPGSSVRGAFQERILEWVAISFSKVIFSTWGLNPGLPHCRQILYCLGHQTFHKHAGHSLNIFSRHLYTLLGISLKEERGSIPVPSKLEHGG